MIKQQTFKFKHNEWQFIISHSKHIIMNKKFHELDKSEHLFSFSSSDKNKLMKIKQTNILTTDKIRFSCI